MKLKLHEKVVFRVPQFPVDATLEESWDELKSSIALASNEFYQYIKNIDYEEYESLSEPIKITVQKYFNRAKFRATPYGTFAGFGVCGIDNENQGIQISTEIIQHCFTDWPQHEHASECWQQIPNDRLLLVANGCRYTIDDQIRYIAKHSGHFGLTDVPYDDTISTILRECSQPIPFPELAAKLEVGHDTLRGWVGELVEAQLLYTNYHPNIIGEDYFWRIGYQTETEEKQYIITERTATAGGIDKRLCEQLTQLITILQSICPTPKEPDNLREFKTRFLAKYDQMDVLLLHALDPETGIGYGSLETETTDQEWLIELAQGRHHVKSAETPQSLQQYLSAQLAMSLNNDVIHLDNYTPETTPSATHQLPNSFIAMLSIADDKMVLDTIGGCTANGMLGRLSIAGDKSKDLCREISGLEQSANPDVLFFDVAYIAEKHIDNVNRRQTLYDCQLSLLNYDTSPMPLSLSDVFVRVSGNELILYSEQYGKRLIPRIATAYNPVRSDLSVFRLICDLQYQGLQTNLTFDMEKIYPGLHKYPQVRYKDIIIQPAKWKLALPSGKTSELSSFKEYLQSIHISRYFKVGIYDQTLLLHRDNDEDMLLLISILQKRGELWASEQPLPKKSPIYDTNQRPYLGEFLLTFTHNSTVHTGINLPIQQTGSQQVNRIYHPGSEWLYAEIYIHPIQSDELLCHEISELLNTCQAFIKKWFFIRYNEQGDHIRLRIHLFSAHHAGMVLHHLHRQVHPKTQNGFIRDVQIKSYHRELERYGSDMMDAVEKHFCTDSNLALQLIRTDFTNMDKYAHCINILRQVRNTGIIDLNRFDNTIRQVIAGFNTEHSMKGNTFKVLNNQYKEYRNHAKPSSTAPSFPLFIESIQTTLEGYEAEKRTQVFTDLMHMHVNRLFSTHQRTHEMVIYNYFIKDNLRESNTQVKKTITSL